jgi:hypothetical protein
MGEETPPPHRLNGAAQRILAILERKIAITGEISTSTTTYGT